MELSATDAKKWHEDGMSILGFKEKLNNKVAGKNYSADFEDIYYGASRSKSSSEIADACNKLAKGVLNLSSNEQKLIVRNFVSTSKLALKDIQSFWAMLGSNGCLPVDPEVARKRAEEDARIRRQKEEQERRIRRAQEARKREERERKLDRARHMGMLITLVISGVVAVLLIIFALEKGFSSYKYYYTEYKALIVKSEELSGQYKYTEALAALQDARNRKSSKKKIQEVDRRISAVLAERDGKCATLRSEIAKVWDSYFVKSNGRVSNTLNKSIVKYVQRGDIQPIVESTLSKIDLLKMISSNTKEYDANMAKIKILKTYYKL